MNLLKIEWLKIRRYNTFWILCSLFGVLFLSWYFMVTKLTLNLNGAAAQLFADGNSFSKMWGNMAFHYSYFVIFLCVFIIISVTNEFSYRTNRQHIIDGMNRLDFLHAKVFLVLSITAAATLFFLAVGLIFGFVNGGVNPLDGIEKLAYVFIYTLNYLSFATLLAFFIKRSGLSIILFLAYLTIENILKGIIFFVFKTHLGNLLPLQASDELLPLNAMKSLGSMTKNIMPETPLYLLIGFSLIYIGLYYVILRKRMLTADL